MMNISLRATDNINDNASTSIQKGFGNDSTPEGFILQLRYRETTFEITFTCVILTIAFFGCIGNLATIGKIVYDPKYHKPTFAVIGQLALADFLSVTVLTFDNMTNFSKFLPEFTVIRDIFQLSSFFHVCLLSAVRYLITVHPLQSRQHLTVKSMCLCSLTIWISSGVVIIGLIYTVEAVPKIYVLTTYLIFNVLILLIVCSVVALLHVKKIRTLQNSLSVTEQSQRRMNIVVTVIISIFVLYQLFIVAGKIIFTFSDQLIGYYLVYGFVIIGSLNFSCNPYILFLSQII